MFASTDRGAVHQPSTAAPSEEPHANARQSSAGRTPTAYPGDPSPGKNHSSPIASSRGKDQLRVRVTGITAETPRIKSFELRSDDGEHALPAFTAGSHIEVSLPGGYTRQYSLCNASSERHRYVLGVLREQSGGGGSQSFHDRVSVGDRLMISRPRNNFELDETADNYVFIAAGIGITPIISMCHRLDAINKNYVLYYCTLSPQETGFLHFLNRPELNGRLILHHDFGKRDSRLNLRDIIDKQPKDCHLYYCGPSAFMDELGQLTLEWDRHRVHSERFKPSQTPQRNGSFIVRLARSGAEYVVQDGQTISDVLISEGIDVDVSCESGVCGTCKTRYLRGNPQHNDVVLNEQERKTHVMICCARSLSPVLVLDIPEAD